MASYRYNPDLPIIKTGWPGNPYDKGAFGYVKEPFFPEWRTIFRMMTTPNPQAEEKKADQWRPQVIDSREWMADKSRDFIIWLGHASFIIQLGGVRFITDPVLQDIPFVPRLVQNPFPPSEITGIDYILLSHDHRDHCDRGSLQGLLQSNQPRKILAPLEMNRTISGWVNGTPIEMAGWYQQFKTEQDEPQVYFLPTRHWSRRGLFDFNKVLWGAFLIEYEGRRYYFGGDSSLHWHYEDTASLFPGIDMAMLGIGAYAPAYMMQDVHTNPEEAVTAWQQLGAKRLLPMHYGTYDLSNEPISEPYRRVQQAMSKVAAADQLLLPGINEPIYL